MSTNLRDGFRRRGPVPKILIASAALSAVGLIGAGAANAAGATTTAGHGITHHAVTTKSEPTGPDTDNIQSGDQTTPDATSVTTVSKVDKVTAGDKKDANEPTGKDTDNIQSGDQTGPDTPGAGDTNDSSDTKDSSEPSTGKDTDNIRSGDQSGPETPDSGKNR